MLKFLKNIITAFATFVADHTTPTRVKFATDSKGSSVSPLDGQDSDYGPQPMRAVQREMQELQNTQLKNFASHQPQNDGAPGIKKASVKRKRVDNDITSYKKIKSGTVVNVVRTNDASTSRSSGSTGRIANQYSDESSQDIDSHTSMIVENAKKFHTPWKNEEVVASTTNIPVQVAKNVMSLLDKDCTIPFVARYRQEKIEGLSPEKLKEIQTAYEEVKQVRKKVDIILKTVKSDYFDEKAAASLMNAKTLNEVELLYAPFQPAREETLLERARQAGLESVALQIMNGALSITEVNFANYMKPAKK